MMQAEKNPVRISACRGMGFQPMQHRQDADATRCGTAFQAVDHGQDAHATSTHGQNARATKRPCGPTKNSGFTLAEVLVASTISGFIALVAVGALNAISSSAQRVRQVTETTAEIRFAARMLAHDLTNLYRDLNAQNMKLIGSSEGDAQGGPPFLTFYTVGRAKARANQPEGDVYEVEYFLGTREQQMTNEATGEMGQSTVLFRRLWPNPDKNRSPGGVLTPIAENIGIFQVRFYDGQEWTGEWTEQLRSLPQFVEVTLATPPPEKGDPIAETFTVTFPRLSQAVGAAGLQGGASEGEPSGQGTDTSSPPGSSSGPSSAPSSGSSGAGSKPSSTGSR